jgi:hypothetical protein
MVRPRSGFEGRIFLILPRTGHGSSQLFEMLPVFFRVFSERALFVRGMMHPYFSVGPSRHKEKFMSCLGGLFFLKSHGASSPW